MLRPQDGDKSNDPVGNYIIINGVRRELFHHPTDFAAIQSPSLLKKKLAASSNASVQQLAIGRSRVGAKDGDQKTRNDLMDLVRRNNVVAHHIYLIDGTNDEIAITDRIFLTLKVDNPELLVAIRNRYELLPDGKRGNAFAFKVTKAANANPLKVANDIRNIFDGIESSVPEILIPIQISRPFRAYRRASEIGAGPPASGPPLLSSAANIETCRTFEASPDAQPTSLGPLILTDVANAPSDAVPELTVLAQKNFLLPQQWHLSPLIIGAGDSTTKTSASISAFEAWRAKMSFGASSIVIAIIDDNFDDPTHHPAFTGKKIDDNKFNYVDNDNNPFQGHEEHGTFVASIATACNQMLGVAPGCALLPIRLGLSPMIEPDTLLLALQRASDFADVVNCSFQKQPTTVDYLAAHPSFLPEVEKMISNGGRRKKGLVIVVSSGDYDSPTFLSKADNKDGINVTTFPGLRPGTELVPPNQEVHTSFPEIKDVVVVGSTTSLLRKGVYSNWGGEVTVSAPSNNSTGFPGRQLLAATKSPGTAPDNPDTPFDETFYTLKFGETSASAPMVTGLVALMLSANPELTAKQVLEILKSSADPDQLDPTLDSQANNLQGKFDGAFVGKHSLFFGAGKINALKAIEQALAPQS